MKSVYTPVLPDILLADGRTVMLKTSPLTLPDQSPQVQGYLWAAWRVRVAEVRE